MALEQGLFWREGGTGRDEGERQWGDGEGNHRQCLSQIRSLGQIDKRRHWRERSERRAKKGMGLGEFGLVSERGVGVVLWLSCLVVGGKVVLEWR